MIAGDGASATARQAELVRQALRLCERRWSVAVLYALADGPLRFNDLLRAIEKVSSKVLAETLRKLVTEGVLDHAGEREAYRLTELGRSFHDELRKLEGWAKAHECDLSLDDTTATAAGTGVTQAS